MRRAGVSPAPPSTSRTARGAGHMVVCPRGAARARPRRPRAHRRRGDRRRAASRRCPGSRAPFRPDPRALKGKCVWPNTSRAGVAPAIRSASASARLGQEAPHVREPASRARRARRRRSRSSGSAASSSATASPSSSRQRAIAGASGFGGLRARRSSGRRCRGSSVPRGRAAARRSRAGQAPKSA